MLPLPRIQTDGLAAPTVGAPFTLSVDGEATGMVVLEATTNLITWLPISTNRLSGASLILTDPQSVQFSDRFYRIRVP
jgi:hypothetical protein